MHELNEKFYIETSFIFLIVFVIITFFILKKIKFFPKIKCFLQNDFLMFFISFVLFLIGFIVFSSLELAVFIINPILFILSIFFFCKILYKFIKKKFLNINEDFSIDKFFGKIQGFQILSISIISIIGYFFREYESFHQYLLFILLGVIFFIFPTFSLFYNKILYSFLNIIFTMIFGFFGITLITLNTDFGSSGGGLLIWALSIYPIVILPILCFIKILYNFYKK